MSLVGPRPFVLHEADQMLGWSQRRLDLVPGITGLWQVRGRNDVPYEEMIRLDYMYVTNWSVWWDIRLLLQTIPGVLTGRGPSPTAEAAVLQAGPDGHAAGGRRDRGTTDAASGRSGRGTRWW